MQTLYYNQILSNKSTSCYFSCRIFVLSKNIGIFAATVPATPLLESVPRQDFVFYKGDMQYPKQAMDFNWQLTILKERGLILEYHQLCCLAYLEQSIAENGNFSNRLLALMDNNNGISSRSMGFPQEWKTEPLWSI